MVTVRILGTEDLQEFKAAVRLKSIFEKGIPENVRGEIIILPSFKCFGQETRDIDLVVFGRFNPSFVKNITAQGKTRQGKEEERVRREVRVKDFFCCIEVKDHSPRGIRFTSDSRILVRYGSKWSDATDQSERQKYSLMNYLRDKFQWNPYVCNLIWLRNVPKDSLREKQIKKDWLHNCLPSDFGLNWFLHLLCVQNLPYSSGNSEYFLSGLMGERPEIAASKIEEAYRLFNSVRENIGLLTRKKLEKITKSNLLKGQMYAQAIGDKLVVVRGRAGTGKTIKLLHIAHDLCVIGQKRCLILTYNKALVSDIRRTLALADITSDIASATIDVKTIYEFMYALMNGFDILSPSDKSNFLESYEDLKTTLSEYLSQGLLTKTDVQNLMKSKHHEVAWDAILIDESQDWPSNEKEILFTLFHPKSFVIADGVDQLIRGSEHTDWTTGVNYHKPIVSEKKSLRQKANLCRFCSSFAEKVGLDWDIKPKGDLGGGRILIVKDDYSSKLHTELLNDCLKSDNLQYEMLFLVPPSLVDRRKVNNKTIAKFKWTDEWLSWGISLWDGTSADVRSEFPSDPSQHRVLQYDSCRGLEGWIVICLHLDSFFEYKMNIYSPNLDNELALYSIEEMKRKFAFQWMMMPFTRAIDTLVISFRDPSSKVADILRDIGEKQKDFVELIS